MTETAILNQQNTRSDLTLQLSRVIPAERRRVFEAWTRPELMAQWFAPGTMTVTGVTNNPQPGGEYRIDVRGPSACDPERNDVSETAFVEGVYREVVPDELISFTWRGGRFPDEDTLVTVAFKDVEGGTEVTLTHEHFSSAEVMNRHEFGWNGCLAKLAGIFEK